jgi:hypothetical protein
MQYVATINFTSRIADTFVLRAFVYASKFPSHGFYAKSQQEETFKIMSFVLRIS